MKYALGLIALVAAMGFAQGCGDSETFAINGYAKAWFYSFGQEGFSENTFRAYDYTYLTGMISDNAIARVGVEYKSWNGSSSFHICDAFLSMKLMPELSITAGQFKVPFGWAYNCSGGGLYFLDRAAMSATPDFLNYGGRDTGINLHGQIDMVGIDVGFFNGTGTTTDSDTTVNKQIVAKLSVDATDWLTIAGGMSMIGQPEVMDTSGVASDEWSATGINAYALANYPLSDNSELIFEGEFLQAGWAGPDYNGYDEQAGTQFYAMLGAKFGLENSFLTAVLPAVRYESIDPSELVQSGGTEAEDGITVLDGCLNCFVTPKNTVQLGIRNVSYEDDNMDSYTDFYLGWRLNY